MTSPLFTRSELIELRRALELITVEDNDARVNTSAAAVSAKASALRKLNDATGFKDPFENVTGTYDIITGEVKP